MFFFKYFFIELHRNKALGSGKTLSIFVKAAAERGHLAVIEYFINIGFQINLPDNDGATSLYKG